MREATKADIINAVDALYGIMHFVRLARGAMENVELADALPDGPKSQVLLALENALSTIERDAEAAGDNLAELTIGGHYA